MSEQSLQALLELLFGSADELARHLSLAGLKRIAAESLSPRDPITAAAFQVSDALSRHGAIEPFLTYCAGRFENRAGDIECVAAEFGLRLGARARRAYLEALIASVQNRQTLSGLRGFAVELAGVFISRAFSFPDEPAYARNSLLTWIQAQTSGEALLLFGEPGAGKTELLFHTAAELAELALRDPSSPLPLIITAADLVEGKGLEGALRRQGHASENFIVQFTYLATLRYVLLIDGLDEAHASSLLRHLEQERRRLGARLAALVLTSRPAYAPSLRKCRHANLCPLSSTECEEFLARWSQVHDAGSVEQVRLHLDEPGLAEMFTNPMAATLSLFTVRRCPDALRSRARLYASVYGQLLQKWPEHRSPDPAVGSPSKSVAGFLRELAVASLLEQRTGIPRSELEARLQALALDDWVALLDEITVQRGILTPCNGDREFVFHDRRLMEYLAAEQLYLLPPEKLVEHACEPWAHEPVRLAFGLLAARQPDTARALFSVLVALEGADIPGLHDRALRPVLVAADVAGDEPALDVAVAPLLAEALYRRITEEYSNWVGDLVASRARRLARRGGPTFEALKPRLLELLTDESLRKPFFPAVVREMFASRDAAFMGLLHRDVYVRQAACEYLQRHIDDPEVQIRLEYMLFDRGSFLNTEIPFVAGFVLRQALRGDEFAPMLSNLRNILSFHAQMPSCGAAIALHPDEAPAEELAQALAEGLKGSTRIPAEVFEALEAHPDGREALQAAIPNWRELLKQGFFPELQPQPLVRFPYTGVVRARAFEALAGCVELPDAWLDAVLAVPENMHAYTESLDILEEWALYRLLDRVRETKYTLCSVAQEKLGQRAVREPRLADYVLQWWASFTDSHPALMHQFPGRALEPLVLAGDRAAIDAFARWLPHGRQSFGGEPAHFETLIPREVFAHPEIREAAYRWIEPDRAPVKLLALPRLARAWEPDCVQWERVEQMLTDEHQRWIAADTDTERRKHGQCRDYFVRLRGVEIPARTRSIFSQIFDEVVRSPHHRSRVNYDWHQFVVRAIGFARAHRFEQEVETSLRLLAGVGAPPECRRVGLYAACCVLDRLTEDEARRLSHEWSERFLDTMDFDLVEHQALAALIARSADSWAHALKDRLAQQGVTFYHPTAPLTVFQCLPSFQQRAVADSLFRLAQISPIPWVSRHWTERRLVRLADEILRIAFETRVI